MSICPAQFHSALTSLVTLVSLSHIPQSLLCTLSFLVCTAQSQWSCPDPPLTCSTSCRLLVSSRLPVRRSWGTLSSSLSGRTLKQWVFRAACSQPSHPASSVCPQLPDSVLCNHSHPSRARRLGRWSLLPRDHLSQLLS